MVSVEQHNETEFKMNQKNLEVYTNVKAQLIASNRRDLLEEYVVENNLLTATYAPKVSTATLAQLVALHILNIKTS